MKDEAKIDQLEKILADAAKYLDKLAEIDPEYEDEIDDLVIEMKSFLRSIQ